MAVNRNKKNKTIPVIEETFHVDKEVVDVGAVRILKRVAIENVTVPLTSRFQGHSVEHITINTFVDEPPPALRYEGNTMIISVIEEESVVVKRLKLVEEIRITPFEREAETEIEITLKKERIAVEKGPINRSQNNKID